MAVIDVNTFIGGHPHRHVPHPEPEILVRVLERERVDAAWVGHLPTAFADDVARGNDILFEELEPHRAVLFPAPVVRPGRAEWQQELARCVDLGAAAIRAYPEHWAMRAGDADLGALGAACGEAELPLVLSVRLEDPARRDWAGAPADLGAATIVQLVRGAPQARVVVTAAQGPLVDEVAAALGARERARVWWDISWIAGPPRDDLGRFFSTMGPGRFLYGSQWPLRLTQTPRANLELLPPNMKFARLALAAELFGR